jgi:hypothetical protein
MPHDGFAAHDEANEQAAPAMSGTEPGATPDSVPTSRPEPVVGFDKTPDPDPGPDSALAPEPEPTLDVEPTADSDLTTEHQCTLDLESTSGPEPTPKHSLATLTNGLAGMTDLFQRHVLPLLIPPALLLVITVIVVTLGSALLLLSASELTIGPIVIAWPVVAAALGVLVIGFGALWLASRETVSPGDP